MKLLGVKSHGVAVHWLTSFEACNRSHPEYHLLHNQPVQDPLHAQPILNDARGRVNNKKSEKINSDKSIFLMNHQHDLYSITLPLLKTTNNKPLFGAC